MWSVDGIEPLLARVPEPLADALIALSLDEQATAAQWEATLLEVITYLDQQHQRAPLGVLCSQLMPVDTLVPERYRAWRPLVRDAVAFLGTHLAPARLAPKLVEQILLPADTPLPQRVVAFMARMPGLQKIGQMVARNPYLDASFRAELRQLENAVHDVDPATIRAAIDRQLGPRLATYAVALEETQLAEASVSAVVRFTWDNPATGRREHGVFKVLKPYVSAYFTEELTLLRDFAAVLDVNRAIYALAQAQVRELLEDVGNLLAAEINMPGEQANLLAAARHYGQLPGVRIPRLLSELSTPTITAMSEERGVKVTDACPGLPWKRQQIAVRLLEVVLAVPLFAPQEEALFHADPHAGNLFYDTSRGDVLLFDWALTQRVSRAERRHLVRLILGVVLRDEAYICQALTALCPAQMQPGTPLDTAVRQQVQCVVRGLSPWSFPGLRDVIALLDTLVFAGLTFSSALLILRKVLFTLEGVLHDVAPGVPMESVFAWYALTQGTGSISQLCPLRPAVPTFRSPLSPGDWLALGWSALGFGSRVWRQGVTRVWDAGWQAL